MPLVRDGCTKFLLLPGVFLIKNIGLCFRFSSSLNKVALIETSDATR